MTVIIVAFQCCLFWGERKWSGVIVLEKRERNAQLGLASCIRKVATDCAPPMRAFAYHNSAGILVQILVLVKAEEFKRFRAAVPVTYDVQSVVLRTLEVRLAESDAKLVVVDPSRMRPAAFIALVEMARAQGNAAVLVYAPLTPETARVAVEASRIQPIETIFSGSYDKQDALAQMCTRLMVPSVPALLLRGLAANLAAMPPLLATRIVGFFGGQPIPPSTSAMLDGLGVATETARDWLAAVGIAHAHHLRSCVSLARAFPELGRNRHRLEHIVEHSGAGSVRAFRRACSTLTGLSPRRAGRLPEAEFARRLLSVVLGPHDPLRATAP